MTDQNKSQVHQQTSMDLFEVLGERQERERELIGKLEERLAPFLLPPKSRPGEDEAIEEPYRSRLAELLGRAVSTQSDLNAALCDLLDRIDA